MTGTSLAVSATQNQLLHKRIARCNIRYLCCSLRLSNNYPPIELVSGNTINNTSSGGAAQQGIAIGVPGSTGVDATSGTVASGALGTTATCNSITPSNASDLVVAIFFMLDTSVITVTPAGGFTLLGGAGINDGTLSPSVYVTYLANAGTGALTPSISWTGNHTATVWPTRLAYRPVAVRV